ncbi:MAG: hypothetical protein IK051_07760 [Rhodocyclaceae bacterium]|nr:hypothetical protein [Rhodocyclaceae bacterium]MBR4877209.1 hypothetical protein [Rhodocyclaceae bacterium]
MRHEDTEMRRFRKYIIDQVVREYGEPAEMTEEWEEEQVRNYMERRQARKEARC